MDLRQKIRAVPDFPKKGIMFRDITTLLQDPEALKDCINQIVSYWKNKNINVIVAAESRGFIFGALIAHALNAGFVPVRKPGKLPWKTIKQEFETEYSTDAFEMHSDAIKKEDNVLIVDDLLATGGTAEAAAKLVEQLGGKVAGFAFIIELNYLNGRKKIEKYEIQSIVKYESE